ncbi:MAG: dienelactone hydrolase family protein [Caldilineaceae bacterium]|nr:dienelactone hydrolase family protein [Caldilineaceae bacterium]
MGKWILRIGVGIIGVVLLAVIVLAGIIIFDTNFGAEARSASNVTYRGADGRTLQGYLAQPQGPGPHPAVLMFHEWWGLNEEIPHLADALAGQGYVVLAPDLYRGRVASTVPGALWMRITTPNEPIWADADSALTYLRGLDTVDPERVASMGFCFGGEQSLQLGLRRAEDLTAVVLFYGSTVTDPTALQALADAQPVLAIFGAEDAQIPVSEVEAFRAALSAAGIEHTVTVYDGVGHAFVTAENYDQPGTPGEAWQQLVAFLEENVR